MSGLRRSNSAGTGALLQGDRVGNKHNILLERQENLCTLTISRPQKKNALSPELVCELNQTLDDLAQEDSIRTLIIRGAGDQAFCAGYDIAALPTATTAEPFEPIKRLNPIEALFGRIVHYPCPVIAMINGVAFGAGCEIAICCDIRVAADDVRMSMPPAKLGLVYPWTGLQRFLQVAGLRSTREMMFTGRVYQGARLKELGLVDYLVSREQLQSFTHQIAAEIAANAPLALKGTKRIINLLLQSAKMSENDARSAEAIMIEAFASDDLKEGRTAFAEKRPPDFKGR
jgi:enoyl-CoA hydratase/carnithine racemase